MAMPRLIEGREGAGFRDVLIGVAAGAGLLRGGSCRARSRLGGLGEASGLPLGCGGRTR